MFNFSQNAIILSYYDYKAINTLVKANTIQGPDYRGQLRLRNSVISHLLLVCKVSRLKKFGLMRRDCTDNFVTGSRNFDTECSKMKLVNFICHSELN